MALSQLCREYFINVADSIVCTNIICIDKGSAHFTYEGDGLTNSYLEWTTLVGAKVQIVTSGTPTHTPRGLEKAGNERMVSKPTSTFEKWVGVLNDRGGHRPYMLSSHLWRTATLSRRDLQNALSLAARPSWTQDWFLLWSHSISYSVSLFSCCFPPFWALSLHPQPATTWFKKKTWFAVPAGFQ